MREGEQKGREKGEGGGLVSQFHSNASQALLPRMEGGNSRKRPKLLPGETREKICHFPLLLPRFCAEKIVPYSLNAKICKPPPFLQCVDDLAVVPFFLSPFLLVEAAPAGFWMNVMMAAVKDESP